MRLLNIAFRGRTPGSSIRESMVLPNLLHITCLTRVMRAEEWLEVWWAGLVAQKGGQPSKPGQPGGIDPASLAFKQVGVGGLSVGAELGRFLKSKSLIEVDRHLTRPLHPCPCSCRRRGRMSCRACAGPPRTPASRWARVYVLDWACLRS